MTVWQALRDRLSFRGPGGVRAGRDAYVATNQYFIRDGHQRYHLQETLLRPIGELSTLSPSQLLSVGNRAVPFAFRESEMRELARWRDDGPDLSVYLLYGPGGQGKTRLADRFFVDSRESGWQAFAARHVTELPFPAAGTPTAGGPDGAALIVVDYADRWPADDLLRLAYELADTHTSSVRLLLLARSRDWWIPLRHRLDKLGWELNSRRLASLAHPSEDRAEVFHQARDRFAAILGVEDEARSPADLQSGQFDLVLSLHMTALASVLAAQQGAADPVSSNPCDVSAYLLDRERSYWESLRTAGRINTKLETMSRVVVGAVLAGPLPHPGGVSLLECARICSSAEPAGLILDDHRVCYPTADAGNVLQPLYPDRLAEDFLALQIPGAASPEMGDGDPAVDSVLANLLSPTADLPDEVVERVLVVLIETSRRWSHVADRHIYRIVTARPDLGFTFTR